MEQEADAERRIEDYLAAHRDDEAAEARAMEFYTRLRLVGPLERKLSAAFRAQPDDLLAACDLARFYLEQRRDAEAADCLSRFDGFATQLLGCRCGRISLCGTPQRFRRKEEEIRWARQALEKDPARPEYALHLADLLQADGQTEAMVERVAPSLRNLRTIRRRAKTSIAASSWHCNPAGRRRRKNTTDP